ncbi:MAG: hypothetical protein NTW75_16675 [Planctomycetales bacterium]|nr:hypothetical protein [Planctomycetales bacterium]
MRPATGDQQRTRDDICNAELDSVDDQQLSLANERLCCAVLCCAGGGRVWSFGSGFRSATQQTQQGRPHSDCHG